MSTSSKDYTRFACPNDKCKMHGQFNQGNIAHHSWIGKNKNINRLRCKKCQCNFSENRGTLRERARIEEEKQERLLKCFRWGVCEEGCADICKVSLKTVQLFRKKAALHGKKHHGLKVKEVDAPGIQMDELRAKQGGSLVTWVGAAMAINSFLILAVTVGQRNQHLANNLLAEIWGRCKRVGMFLSDGWSCYYKAILLCFGRIYSPRKSEGKRGRKKAERLKLKKSDPFYGQVVKQTTKWYELCAVKCRAILGTMKECLFFIKAYGLGTKINTSHIERWFGNVRCHIASLRRKSRCLGRSPIILGERLWIYVTLHNWIIPHASLVKNGIKITPAMAAGLIDHPMTYQEYLHLPVFSSKEMDMRIKGKLQEMESEEKAKALKRTRRKKYQERVLWEALPPEKIEEVA